MSLEHNVLIVISVLVFRSSVFRYFTDFTNNLMLSSIQSSGKKNVREYLNWEGQFFMALGLQANGKNNKE